jgi:hypothetical protein
MKLIMVETIYLAASLSILRVLAFIYLRILFYHLLPNVGMRFAIQVPEMSFVAGITRRPFEADGSEWL